jgi:two-component SAPR family response regulator
MNTVIFEIEKAVSHLNLRDVVASLQNLGLPSPEQFSL